MDAWCETSWTAQSSNNIIFSPRLTLYQVDRRSRQIEDVIQLQRRLNAQMEQLDADAQREIEASIRHETAVNQLMAQSEPTTPPEYQDAFPSMFCKAEVPLMDALTRLCAQLSCRVRTATPQLVSPRLLAL